MATITLFGRPLQVSSRYAKLFCFVGLPLLLVSALFNGYLVISAAAQATGIHFFWVLLLTIAALTTLTFNSEHSDTVVGLLKNKWAKAVFNSALVGHALYFYAKAEEPVYVYCLAAFTVCVLVSKLRARSYAKASASTQPTPKTTMCRGQLVEDIEFKEVRH